MNDATKRSIFRWIHIVFSIPIIGYVYSPFKELPNYAPVVRFVSIPVLVLVDYGCGSARSFAAFFRTTLPDRSKLFAPASNKHETSMKAAGPKKELSSKERTEL